MGGVGLRPGETWALRAGFPLLRRLGRTRKRGEYAGCEWRRECWRFRGRMRKEEERD